MRGSIRLIVSMLIAASVLQAIPVGAASGSISGVVRNADTGQPISGVSVSAKRPSAVNWATDSTDSQGRYTISGLESADYEVRFSAAGYVLEWYDDAAKGEADLVTVSGNAVTGIDASLERAGAVSGRVTDDDTGSGISGASVAAWSASTGEFSVVAFANSSGYYTINGLGSGAYHIQFLTGGSHALEWYDDVSSQSSATTVTVSAPSTTSGVNAGLARAGSVSGSVSVVGGGGLSGVLVEVFEDRSSVVVGSVTTDGSGSYSVSGVAAGSVSVRFSRSGYVGEWWSNRSSQASADLVSVSAGGVATVNAALAAVPVSYGSVAGTLTVEGSGGGLGGVTVKVWDASSGLLDGSVTTNAAGSYSVGGLVVDDYKVEFVAPSGYVGEWWSDESSWASADLVSVSAGGVATVNAALAATDPATGSVVRRLAGSDRYATAAAVSADTFPGGANRVYVATGDHYADALAGGPAGGVNGAPILLVRRDSIPGPTAGELGRLSPNEIVILGGPSAVSSHVQALLQDHTG